MTIGARCGSCDRELLLVQLAHPSQGFRCLFCGFAFAPAYATVAPGVATRIMAAHATLVTPLAELASMTGDRLRLDARHSPRHGTWPPGCRGPRPPSWPTGLTWTAVAIAQATGHPRRRARSGSRPRVSAGLGSGVRV
jgi:hypothetical protein